LKRWTTKDPIGFRGGNNFYAYVGNDPVNNIDPSGLDLIVITGGYRGGLNPFGHVAVGVQGGGMASYGNGFNIGSSVLDYLLSQSADRDQLVTIIPTTPEQDEKARQYMKDHPDWNSIGKFDNCANRSNQILDAAGVPNRGFNLPNIVAADAINADGSKTYYIPKGSPLPPDILDILEPSSK
jgi:hypothetical protein